LREIGEHEYLDDWLRVKVLAGMAAGRIGRGRETRLSLLGGATRAELPPAACHEDDEAESEVRDYMVYSGLLWRLRPRCGSWHVPSSGWLKPTARPATIVYPRETVPTLLKKWRSLENLAHRRHCAAAPITRRNIMLDRGLQSSSHHASPRRNGARGIRKSAISRQSPALFMRFYPCFSASIFRTARTGAN
jgi:hypothetical protein